MGWGICIFDKTVFRRPGFCDEIIQSRFLTGEGHLDRFSDFLVTFSPFIQKEDVHLQYYRAPDFYRGLLDIVFYIFIHNIVMQCTLGPLDLQFLSIQSLNGPRFVTESHLKTGKSLRLDGLEFSSFFLQFFLQFFFSSFFFSSFFLQFFFTVFSSPVFN